MVEGVWLDQFLKMYPHNLRKALRMHGDYAKLQGDACIHLSTVMTTKPLLLREFANYGLGIHPVVVANANLAHKDQDYNAAWVMFRTSNKMWSLFYKYFIISSLVLIAALGENWLQGVIWMGI